LLYSVIAAGSLGSLSEVWGELTQAAGSADRVFELLDEVGEQGETQRGVLSQPAKGEIRFTDVHFAYPAAPETEVIKGLSMSVAPGETVALVGASGSGKTTLLSLLLGFYDNQRGGITIDGRDLGTLARRSVRSEISVVPQDVTIFAASIFENIAFGRPDATREQVIAAARKAQADEFISKLDLGYETVVGERGMTLSGGQRQRIAIARALLKDAPILLLDEATAALDAENEACVQEALDGLVENRSTIVIAHRLATVLKADRILVVEDGRIVEEGNHVALMRQNGTYARLAKLQFKDSAGEKHRDAA
ncbi:MAG: ATP-binding cassette domain-containing protein, partial [Pararhizobium sp.]